MQHVVLQVTIGGPHRAPEPRGDEDAYRGHTVGMHIEEAEDFGLGIAESVKHRPRLQGGARREIDASQTLAIEKYVFGFES